ncbi:MAG TPA: sigma-54 dependent transcriptional regulator [Candidatus Binatia bacterium]|jgi:DNA-binding NtrC family response regulator
MNPSVLILDQNSLPCAVGRCDAIGRALRDYLPIRSCVQQRCYDRLPQDVGAAPDLVLVRPAADRTASELISSCKNKWRRASILALLCPRRDRLLDPLSPLLTEVDDFIACPFEPAELFLRIKRLIQRRLPVLNASGSHAVRKRPHLDSLVGESEKFLRTIERIAPLAVSNAPVLISGETGTGKELFARALHYQGPRHGKPFIPVNCGALPDHLFENELFGHAKGAFTDANTAQKGLIAEVEGGTLFLDEVDTLSASAQVKLLRFLQDGEWRPLGSSHTVVGDVRVIAATNADLHFKVEQKTFREDLYHRLNVLSLTIPSLRERFGDIALLANYFLDRYCRQYSREMTSLSTAALQKLMSYSWPGNVRELEAVIQRTVVLNSPEIVQPEHLEVPSLADSETPAANRLREAKSAAVGGFEQAYLANLMAAHRGNVSHAAKAAGKDRRTFQRLLRRYNIDRMLFR